MLKSNFLTRYGVEPFFILDKNWFSEDSTITMAHTGSKHAWFGPKCAYSNPYFAHFVHSVHTYVKYNGGKWGCVVPSFCNLDTLPGCGKSCREVLQSGGDTLRNGLNDGLDATFIMLKPWMNIVKSAGFYRSLDWSYPTQYINIV